MKIHHLKPPEGAKTRKRRVGRGDKGRRGAKAGRGTKGTHSRGSGKLHVAFEGGQMPLVRRQPKLPGFDVPSKARRGRVDYAVVNVSTLEHAFEAGDEVTVESLQDKGLVPRKKDTRVKILGHGELTVELSVLVHKASGSAREKIEAAGGSIEETDA